MVCCVHQLVAKFVCRQLDGGKGFLGGGDVDIFHQRGLRRPQKILMFHPDGCGLEGQRGAFPSVAITFGFPRKGSHSFVNVSVIILAIISWKEL